MVTGENITLYLRQNWLLLWKEFWSEKLKNDKIQQV